MKTKPTKAARGSAKNATAKNAMATTAAVKNAAAKGAMEKNAAAKGAMEKNATVKGAMVKNATAKSAMVKNATSPRVGKRARSGESIRGELMGYLRGLRIVDAHEHLPLECDYVKRPITFYDLLIPYIQFDLYSAGMPREWLWRAPQSAAEEETYWRTIGPLWNVVRHGSYARALLLTMREFWGFSDLTDGNYRDVAAAARASNRPGLYRRTLVEKCGIDTVLTLNNRIRQDQPFMRGHLSFDLSVAGERMREFAAASGSKSGVDDFAEHLAGEAARAKSEGAALVKFYVHLHFQAEPDRATAAVEFARVARRASRGTSRARSGSASPARSRAGRTSGLGIVESKGAEPSPALKAYLADRLLARLGEIGLVAAVHTGVWGDIRTQHPGPLYSVVGRYRDTAFDVYHLGMPFTGECGFLAKNYPNVFLNLCWCHVVSPAMTVRALDEILDHVPTSKIFGFGGDYTGVPEKVWGHLEMARENLAEVVARRVERSRMDLDDAKDVLRLWMAENPKRVYGV